MKSTFNMTAAQTDAELKRRTIPAACQVCGAMQADKGKKYCWDCGKTIDFYTECGFSGVAALEFAKRDARVFV